VAWIWQSPASLEHGRHRSRKRNDLSRSPAPRCATQSHLYTAYTVALAALLAVAGCIEDPPAADAGPPSDGPEAGFGRLELEIAGLKAMLPDGVVFDHMAVGVEHAQLVADRAEASALEVSDAGLIELPQLGDINITVFNRAPPATYSGADATIGPGTWGTTFEFRITRLDGPPIFIHSDARMMVSGRCTVPYTLEPGATVEVDLELKLHRVWETLAAATLPAPIDGVVTIDRASAPEVLDLVDETVLTAWRSECEPPGV